MEAPKPYIRGFLTKSASVHQPAIVSDGMIHPKIPAYDLQIITASGAQWNHEMRKPPIRRETGRQVFSPRRQKNTHFGL
jgi:hypothetical protein